MACRRRLVPGVVEFALFGTSVFVFANERITLQIVCNGDDDDTLGYSSGCCEHRFFPERSPLTMVFIVSPLAFVRVPVCSCQLPVAFEAPFESSFEQASVLHRTTVSG